MQAAQTSGIDLPLKALAWEDATGKVRLSYNDPAWLADRHGIAPQTAPITQNLSGVLVALSKHAVGS
jgi:uncharacterized protein (DUF302 family)